MTRRGVLAIMCSALVAVASACAAAAHHSSPWEFGGGVHLAPGWQAGQGDVTAHPHFGYTYLSFDGGHDDLFEIGGQLRKPVDLFGEGSWMGAEANFARLRTSSDYGDGSSVFNTNGFSFAALVGAPVGESRWNASVYGGAGLSHLGSTGINLRVGVDLQPWFLKR